MNYNNNFANNVGGWGNPIFGRENRAPAPAAAPIRNFEFVGWNRVNQNQNPNRDRDQRMFIDQPFMREQRAQAGGNRMVNNNRQRPQFVARPVLDNHQGQLGDPNQANNQAPMNPVQQQLNRRLRLGRNSNRRDSRQTDTEISSSTRARRRSEYDMREEECWKRIDRKIHDKTHSFSSISPPTYHNFFGFESSHNIHIPNDAEICAMLRNEEQRELIMDVRDQLNNSKTSHFDLRRALEKIDMHLRNNEIEYQMIESTVQQLVNTSNTLENELSSLDDLLAKVHRLTI